MPKISKFSRHSSELKRSVDGEVFYHLDRNRHSSSGFFYVPIPPEMEAFVESFEGARHFHNRGISKKIVEGESAEEAEKTFVKFVEAFNKANTTSEKVILYRFRYSSKNKTSDKGNGRQMFDGVENSHEAKIEFDWCVAIKRKFGVKITYDALDKDPKIRSTRSAIGPNSVKEQAGGSYGSWIEFPYSEDTEAFLTKVYAGMESIMENFEKFMKTKEQALESIRNQQKMLV